MKLPPGPMDTNEPVDRESPTSIRLPLALRAEIASIAITEERTESWVMRRLLEEAIRARAERIKRARRRRAW